MNWANGEYDHHHALLLQFARSADRRWYFLGDRAARHAIDVDTCHYGPHRGGESIHSMGHTGGFFDKPYEGNGIPGPGFTVSHTWTEGFCDWYALSGDPTARENAILVADHYDGAYLNNYDYPNARTNGWHLLLTMATYRLTGDPFYLNAARIIVRRTLEMQSPEGGWQRQLVPGHCLDMPRHRGEANFMLGVLGNGLEEYYRQVPDPRVAQAIVGGARQAIRELWVDKSNAFRYTSCPNSPVTTANNDMTAEILLFAHRLDPQPQFADVGLRAMRAALAGGIGSIAHLRWTPHILYNMDQLQQGRPGGAAPAVSGSKDRGIRGVGWRRGQGPEPSRQAKPAAFPRGFHVPTHLGGNRGLEVPRCDPGRGRRATKVTICDLEARRKPEVSAPRLHGAGGGHAFGRAAQPAGRRRERRDHAGVRSPATDAGLACRFGPKARRAGEEVRCPVQNRLRRHPATHDSARAETQAENRISREGG